jgi:hypothetical protein
MDVVQDLSPSIACFKFAVLLDLTFSFSFTQHMLLLSADFVQNFVRALRRGQSKKFLFVNSSSTHQIQRFIVTTAFGDDLHRRSSVGGGVGSDQLRIFQFDRLVDEYTQPTSVRNTYTPIMQKLKFTSLKNA